MSPERAFNEVKGVYLIGVAPVVRIAGDVDNGNLEECLPFAQFLCGFNAAHGAHFHIQKDQVIVLGCVQQRSAVGKNIGLHRNLLRLCKQGNAAAQIFCVLSLVVADSKRKHGGHLLVRVCAESATGDICQIPHLHYIRFCAGCQESTSIQGAFASA